MKELIRSNITIKASSIHDNTNTYDCVSVHDNNTDTYDCASTHERTTTPPRIFRSLFQTKDSPSLGRRSSGFMSFIVIIFITILVSIASSNNTFATTSTLSIAVNDIVSLNLGSASNGVLVGSTSTTDTTISVNTTNATGYTLKIAASSGTSGTPVPLSNVDVGCSANCTIPSITTATSTNDASSLTTGTWGYLPSKFNSTTNTVYRPAPTIEGDTLDITSTANASSNNSDNNNYNIAIGAKLDYANTTPGTYSSSFIVTAIANATSYTITYNANAGSDTVTNMPANITNGSTYAETVQLSSNTPVRDNYNFLGWCTVQTTDGQACSDAGGASYALSSNWTIDQTSSSNALTLYAVWESVVTYTQTVNYYYQTATGTSGTMETYTEDVEEGSNFTFTYAKAASFNSTTHSTTMYTANNGTTSTTINYTVTGPTTNTVYFNRNTRKVTLTKGAGISAVTVTGTGVKSGSGTASATVYYGGTATINATLSSGFAWVNWTGSATYTNQSQSISNITANKSFTANANCTGTKTLPSGTGIMQTWSKPSSLTSYCEGASTTLTDSRSGNKSYTVAKIGNLVWMTKNLDLPGGITLTSSDSNLNGSLTTYDLPASSTSGFSNNSTAYVYNSGRTTCSSPGCYSYYSYAAATAGTNPSSGNASSDICPKGWRLPTLAEFNTLKGTYTTGATLTASPFLGVYAGFYDNSSFNDGGAYGVYWSSTAAAGNTNAANRLYFDSGSVGASTTSKFRGFPVRCVAK